MVILLKTESVIVLQADDEDMSSTITYSFDGEFYPFEIDQDR